MKQKQAESPFNLLAKRFSENKKEDTMKQKENTSILNTLEKNFAAAGLAEGDGDLARGFLASEPESRLWKRIREAYASFQHHFVAAALAEGCPDTAKRYMEKNLDYSKKSQKGAAFSNVRQWLGSLEKTFVAAGLAEGDPEVARSYLNVKEVPQTGAKLSLEQFLSTTGLKGVRYQYGLMAA